MKTLRLLVVNPQLLYACDGGWRGDSWHDFADSLASRFGSATLLAHVQPSGGEQFDVWPLSHVTVRSLSTSSFAGLMLGLARRRTRADIMSIPRLVRAHDVVLTRIPDPLFPLVAAACRWHGVPLAVAVTGDVLRSNRLASSPQWHRRILGFAGGLAVRWIERLSMLIRTDLAFAYGEEPRRTYAGYARNVMVTREGSVPRASIVRRTTACAGPRIRIVQVAHYHRNKNVPMLLRAVRRLLERGMDIEVHLAGDRTDREVVDSIAAVAADPLFTDRIVEHGCLKRQALYELYQTSDVCTLTSRSEGWPRVLMEAASFGLPIVTTNVGGIPTFIRDGENGLLVPSDDDQALSRAIERVVTDGPLRLGLVEAGYAMASANCREAVVDEWTREIGKRVPDRRRD